MWCPVLGGLLVIVIFPGHARKTVTPQYDCDRNHDEFMREGNQGPVGMFPWLGVIRVTLNEGSKLRIAVTGAVLIRVTHAIADAEDIAKIPNKILREQTKAMFISTDDSPWLYAIRRYDAPPDFRSRTMSSIALVELELKDDPTPLMPICWQDRNHHLSRKHFAVGYTDERYILEKIAYNMQFINKTQCEIYYDNLDMHAKKYVPVHYQCWAAMKNTRNCMWENGMVLVSNYTGTWFLIGLGIRGPGCSLPVRFISVLNYVEWIETMINEAFMRLKSRRLIPRIKELPAHTFYAANLNEDPIDKDEIREFDGIPFRRAYSPPKDGSPFRRLYQPYEPNTTEPPIVKPETFVEGFYEEEHWKRDDIRHMDPNVLQFKKFGNKYERVKGDCSIAGHLVYREIAEITKTPNVIGYGYYKLSLVDLEIYRYTCVVIRVISRTRSDCNLWYSIAKAMDEPLTNVDDTPGQILKHFIPAGERSTTAPWEMNPLHWEPHQTLEAFFKKEGDHPLTPKWWLNQTMLNLYLKFDFVDDAQLVLEVWAPSSEGLYELVQGTPKPAQMNATRTRRKKHNYTRPTRRRTRRSTIRTKRTRSWRPARPKPFVNATPVYNASLRTNEDEFINSRMRKAVITLLDNLTAKSGSNSSNYVLCLILILFVLLDKREWVADIN